MKRTIIASVALAFLCACGSSTGALPASTQPPASPEFTDPVGGVCLPWQTSAGYCPGDSPSPTPPPVTMVSQTETIVFSVTGTGDPTVDLWGSNSSQNDAGTVSLPWQASMAPDGGLYYAVDAQLQGWGSIQSAVTDSITTKCSNGVVKTETFPMANGSASGGYAIAMAEYVGGDPGNQYQAESDAGC